MDAATILQLWEDNRGQDPLVRALALCAQADPVIDLEIARTMPLGERNARLLRLRMQWSDTDFEATATCPHCHETLEFTVDPAHLLESAELGAIAPLEIDNRVICWRPLTSQDLILAAQRPTGQSAASALLMCCVSEIIEAGETCPEAETTEAERAALAAAVEAADPLCDLLFDLTCVDCGQAVTAGLDIPEAVWGELDRRARQVVSEVHGLASAYGWTEFSCLELSPARRSIYLEQVGAL